MEKNKINIQSNECDDGYKVLNGGFVGYVYPDGFGGWRPYSIYGQVMNAGQPASSTPLKSACYFENYDN